MPPLVGPNGEIGLFFRDLSRQGRISLLIPSLDTSNNLPQQLTTRDQSERDRFSLPVNGTDSAAPPPPHQPAIDSQSRSTIGGDGRIIYTTYGSDGQIRTQTGVPLSAILIGQEFRIGPKDDDNGPQTVIVIEGERDGRSPKEIIVMIP